MRVSQLHSPVDDILEEIEAVRPDKQRQKHHTTEKHSEKTEPSKSRSPDSSDEISNDDDISNEKGLSKEWRERLKPKDDKGTSNQLPSK